MKECFLGETVFHRPSTHSLGNVHHGTTCWHLPRMIAVAHMLVVWHRVHPSETLYGFTLDWIITASPHTMKSRPAPSAETLFSVSRAWHERKDTVIGSGNHEKAGSLLQTGSVRSPLLPTCINKKRMCSLCTEHILFVSILLFDSWIKWECIKCWIRLHLL